MTALGRVRERLRAATSVRSGDAAVGPAGRAAAGPAEAIALVGARTVAAVAALAVVRALGVVALAGGIAAGIAALAAGEAVDGSVLDGTVFEGSVFEGSVWLALAGAIVRVAAGQASAIVVARASVAAASRVRARLARDLLDRGGAGGGEALLLAGPGVERVEDYLRTVVPAFVAAVVVPLVLGVRILAADWLSALILVVTIPLVPVFMVLIGQHTRQRVDAATGALARLAAHMIELARGLPVLVGLGRFEAQTDALDALQRESRLRTRATLRVAFLSALALELIATISVAVIAVTLGIRLLSGTVGLDVALLALLLAPECFGALRDVGGAFHAGEQGRGMLARMRGMRAARARAGSHGRPLVRRLVVRYAGRSTAVGPLDLDLPSSGMTALVGASGAGKSTLLAALTDSLPADAERSGVVRAAAGPVGYAAQRPEFLGATVADELALAASGAAVRDANAVVRSLGIAHLAGAAVAELSPGERRRLAVARAFIRVHAGASLVVLDEPTAHLDPHAAAAVLSAVRRVSRRVPVLVATHDATVVATADSIVVVGEGASPAAQPDPSGTAAARGAAARGAVARGAAASPGVAPDERAPLDATARASSADPVATRSLRAALALLRSWRWLGAIALGALATGMSLALTAVSGWLIVEASFRPPIMILLVSIVGVRFFGLGRAVLRYCERLVTHDAVFAATDRIRLVLWRALGARGAASRRMREGGAPADWLISVLDDVRELAPRVIVPALGAAVALGGVIVTVALVSPVLLAPTAIAVGVALTAAPALALLLDRSSARRRAAARADYLDALAALDTAADEVRIAGLDAVALARVDDRERTLARLDRRSALAEHAGAGLGALSVLALAAIAPALAATSVLSGATGVAAAAVASLLALAAVDPVADVVSAARRSAPLAVSLARLAPLLEPQPRSGPVGRTRPARVEHVDLAGVVARYRGADRAVFAPVTASARRGRWLVVEGPSGAGKSTLLSVLLGAIEPERGGVRVDGAPLRDLDADYWRRTVAWCPQDAHVFDSTVRGNLLVALSDRGPADDARLLEVLHRVGLRPLVPDAAALDLRVGAAGRSLSGGERQRLAVARALLRNADVLLLDEPTAQLDEATAAALMRDLRRATADRIVVLVTHRASDLRADDARVRLRSPLPDASRTRTRRAVAAAA